MLLIFTFVFLKIIDFILVEFIFYAVNVYFTLDFMLIHAKIKLIGVLLSFILTEFHFLVMTLNFIFNFVVFILLIFIIFTFFDDFQLIISI